MDNKTGLIEYGFDEREAEVYLYLLKNKDSTAQEIAKATGIIRQTVYEIVYRMQNKGFIGEIKKDSKSYFNCVNPEKLRSIIQEKQKMIDELIPSLNKLIDASKTSANVEIFKGVNGMRNLLSDCLETNMEIKSIQPIIGEEYMKEYYIENFMRRRLEKKIPIKIIREANLTDFHKNKIISSKKDFREVRILPKIKGISSHFILYSDKLAIASYREEPFGLIIHDKMVAESFSLLFDILWSLGNK